MVFTDNPPLDPEPHTGYTAAQVTAIARKNRLVSSATVFDVFEGKGLPEGKKSLAVRIVYQEVERRAVVPEVP